MTVYNYEQFVTEAINSVLAQDFSDFEIIAVDDGSQDSSWGKINMIRDPRLKCIQQITAIAKKKRSEAAVKACWYIRRKNGLSLSSLCKKEIQNRTYPWYITLLAYIKFLRSWQTENHFFQECLKCFLIIFKSAVRGKGTCK